MHPAKRGFPASTPQLIPEMQLLVCCARRQMGAEEAAYLQALLRAPLDWDRVVGLAGRHKMLPLLAWHLKSEMAAIPRPVAELLQRTFLANAGQMLRLSGELLDLARLFTTERIPVVPYKGPALGAYLYGNLALRQAGDLDILVRRADVVRARELLTRRGYLPRHALRPGGDQFMVRSRYSEVFDGKNGLTVELHWAFTNGDVGLALDLDALAPNLQTTVLGGGSVSIFGREDLLLTLCIHGSKHRWDRLEWLCGVAELLRVSSNDLDWKALTGRATALGTRRMLQLGVLLAHELLGAPVPAPVVKLARADRAVSRLAVEVPGLLTTDPVDAEEAGDLATDLFRLRLRERGRDQLRFIWYRLTTPSKPESWSAVAVGKRWVPVHGFLRPFRVMTRLLPALRHHRVATRNRG